MRVFIVTCGQEYEKENILFVGSTLEKAEAYRNWLKTGDGDYDYVHITEMVVDYYYL